MVLKKINDNKIHRIFIVNNENEKKLLGVISLIDIIEIFLNFEEKV